MVLEINDHQIREKEREGASPQTFIYTSCSPFFPPLSLSTCGTFVYLFSNISSNKSTVQRSRRKKVLFFVFDGRMTDRNLKIDFRDYYLKTFFTHLEHTYRRLEEMLLKHNSRYF